MKIERLVVGLNLILCDGGKRVRGYKKTMGYGLRGAGDDQSSSSASRGVIR